jgi:ferredoxin
MADIANKYSENVPGKFYVDDQCIDCDLCRETAPANFTRSDDGGYSYVFKQPTTPEEDPLPPGDGRMPGRSDREQRRRLSVIEP